MFVWGNRRAPYGAGAILSFDRGNTWNYDRRVSLGWTSPHANCGYTSAAQAADGTIVCLYYQVGPGSDRELDNARAFCVRFREADLIEAMNR